MKTTKSDNSVGITSITKDTWVIIDTCSTFNSAYNDSLARGIKYFETMHQISNGGAMDNSNCGCLNLLLNVILCYSLRQIFSILSMILVAETCCTTMHVKSDDKIMSHTGEKIAQL